ncbi:hypothetical protein [Deinococcus sp. SL84]|nr:hypothetical protein [Deinococcus sp. SL84]MCY1703243.1 hypothetical protein [Deinococcus sp. SL84]
MAGSITHPDPVQGDVLTLEELATFLKVSETTTYSLVSQRRTSRPQGGA